MLKRGEGPLQVKLIVSVVLGVVLVLGATDLLAASPGPDKRIVSLASSSQSARVKPVPVAKPVESKASARAKISPPVVSSPPVKAPASTPVSARQTPAGKARAPLPRVIRPGQAERQGQTDISTPATSTPATSTPVSASASAGGEGGLILSPRNGAQFTISDTDEEEAVLPAGALGRARFISIPASLDAEEAATAAATKGKVEEAALAGQAAPAFVSLFERECRAAQDGNGHAAYRMGRRYMFGLGVPRNKQLGISWMRQAARTGHPMAQRVVNMVPRRWGLGTPYCGKSTLGAGRRLGPLTPPAEIVRAVQEVATQHGVDPALVLAVIRIESGFNTRAVSPKSAAGLMQLIPDTARRFGVSDVFDARQNIVGGVRYLQWLLSYFRGDVTFAVAAYNAGEGAVDKYSGIPPYAETIQYVRLIRQLYPQLRHPYDPGLVSNPSSAVRSQVAEVPR
jgi:soluble lytic murein transglycosylase-like protein